MIKTIQNRFTRDYVPAKDPSAIEVEVYSDNKGKPTLKVYFGTSVKHADYYVLGCDDAGCADMIVPVLLPCEKEDGGYKVRKTSAGGGILRIILTDDALVLFGNEVVEEMRRQTEWHKEFKRRFDNGESTDDLETTSIDCYEYDGEMDDYQRVWLNEKE